jgi:ketosteroid isomerase-like protein
MSYEVEMRNQATVMALYEACGSGDWAKAATMMTEDILITEAPTLPFAGEFRGVEAMRELFGRVFSTGVTGTQLHQATAGGDWVVVLADLILAGDPPVRCPLAEAFRLQDGKVCEIVPYYFNADLMMQAAALRSTSHRVVR